MHLFFTPYPPMGASGKKSLSVFLWAEEKVFFEPFANLAVTIGTLMFSPKIRLSFSGRMAEVAFGLAVKTVTPLAIRKCVSVCVCGRLRYKKLSFHFWRRWGGGHHHPPNPISHQRRQLTLPPPPPKKCRFFFSEATAAFPTLFRSRKRKVDFPKMDFDEVESVK